MAPWPSPHQGVCRHGLSPAALFQHSLGFQPLRVEQRGLQQASARGGQGARGGGSSSGGSGGGAAAPPAGPDTRDLLSQCLVEVAGGLQAAQLAQGKVPRVAPDAARPELTR